MDYIAPTDVELSATTEEEILGLGRDPDGPFADPPVEHPAGRYPVCLGTHTREEAKDMGAFFEYASSKLMRECWIDLKTRTLHHAPGSGDLLRDRGRRVPEVAAHRWGGGGVVQPGVGGESA